MKPHSGFVTILGRPNVGKSTLLNYLVGEKLAGVSDKPQTTRGLVRGIVTTKKGQIVFVDTPGMHDPKDLLGNWMMQEAQKSLADADLVYFMVLPEKVHPYERNVLEILQSVKAPVFLLINQVDRYPKPHILPVIEHYQNLSLFKEIIPISAKKGDQTELLVNKTFEYLPENPPYFPEDDISDQNIRHTVEEIIREKLYHYTQHEIPYSAAVVIDSYQDRNETLVDIAATVFVERESQKAIVVGKNGRMMKQIGQAARLDLEKLIGKKVFLQLWAKVMPDWKKDQNAMKKLGYE